MSSKRVFWPKLRRAGAAGFWFLLLAALLAWGPAARAGEPPARGGLATAASPAPHLRIGVVTDGIYRLTPADFAAAGIDASSLDPEAFALSSLGQPAALRVTGAEDGRFDGSDVIEFFGEGFRGDEQDQKYTDERVYWLEFGDQAGPCLPPRCARIPDLNASPTGALTPPTDFAAVARAERNNLWYTQHTPNPPTRDTWFWDEAFPRPTQSLLRTYVGTAPHPAPAPAVLWIDQNARALNRHETGISLNGAFLITSTWLYKNRSLISATVPTGLLHSGANTVTVKAIAVPGVLRDWLYFNRWELHYRRLFRAWQGQIDFVVETAGPHEYLIDGWASTGILIWDVSDPAQPQRLVGASSRFGPGGISLSFRADDAAGSRSWLQEEGTLPRPHSLRVWQPANLAAPERGADTVIVTAPELRPAADRLAAWHESQGRRALTVDFQQVIDEFNHGIYHPRAVPAMLAWAQTHWPAPAPAFLVLMGDGHWNFKGYNPAKYPPQPNLIPPYLAWIDPEQGEVPADALYGDLDGDTLPDLAVGRLPVNTLAEAQVVVDKIVNYDSGDRIEPWQNRMIFVADNPDEAGNFTAVSNDIIAHYLPLGVLPQRLYLGQTVTDASAMQASIIQGINSGAWMVQYAGHGSTGYWMTERGWTLAAIAELRNPNQLPVVLTFNCLDGYFAFPDPDSFAIAEMMLRHAGGGSVASISPTGLGYTSEQHHFRKVLMQALFQQQNPTLGQALLAAKREYYNQVGGPHYLIGTMTLFGDPALALPQVHHWNFFPRIQP